MYFTAIFQGKVRQKRQITISIQPSIQYSWPYQVSDPDETGETGDTGDSGDTVASVAPPIISGMKFLYIVSYNLMKTGHIDVGL